MSTLSDVDKLCFSCPLPDCMGNSRLCIRSICLRDRQLFKAVLYKDRRNIIIRIQRSTPKQDLVTVNVI